MNTTQHIQQHAAAAPEGTTLCANELLTFGNRAAVDAALSRLARRGQLLRVERGQYVAPVQTRFGSRSPTVNSVVRDWARRHFVPIEPGGAASANLLGLTTQVPDASIWLTTAPSTRLQVGKATVELRHAPAWKVLSGATGAVLRALAWLGRAEAEANWQSIRSTLTAEDKDVLLIARAVTPSWMAELLTSLARP